MSTGTGRPTRRSAAPGAVATPSRSRRACVAAAKALLPVLVLMVCAELGARAFPHRDSFVTRTGFVEPDPDLIWRLAPVASGPLATNRLGLRDTAYRKNADVKILLLGDSVSWGNGIDDVRRVYPYLLERALEAEEQGSTVEVVNASVPGYSTFQELRYLQLHGRELEPDVVVLQFCLNDVVERYRSLAAYGGNDHFLGVDTREAIAGLYGTLIRRSRAFEMLVRGVQHLARDYDQYRASNLSTDAPSAAIVAAWSKVELELDGVHRETAALGVPLLLVIAPYRYQLDDPAGTRQPQDRLLAWARARGVEAVDLLPYFAAAGARSGRLFSDANHFSEAGHALAANALVPPLRALIAAH
jgi:lysophospholipase L1-like esterase